MRTILRLSAGHSWWIGFFTAWRCSICLWNIFCEVFLWWPGTCCWQQWWINICLRPSRKQIDIAFTCSYSMTNCLLSWLTHANNSSYAICWILLVEKKNANFYMDILLCTPQRGVICVMLQLQKPHLFALQLCIVTMCFYTSFFVCWFTEWCCHSFFIFSVWCQHGSICWWKWPSHIFWKWWHIMQGYSSKLCKLVFINI